MPENCPDEFAGRERFAQVTQDAGQHCAALDLLVAERMQGYGHPGRAAELARRHADQERGDEVRRDAALAQHVEQLVHAGAGDDRQAHEERQAGGGRPVEGVFHGVVGRLAGGLQGADVGDDPVVPTSPPEGRATSLD